MKQRRLPAEWEPQECVVMAFPHAKSDWASDLQSAESVFLRMASSISALQKLILLCDDVDRVKKHFCYHDRISFVSYETNDTWTRDFAPLSLYEGDERILLDFHFNAWGGKYPYDLDDKVNRFLYEQYHFYPSRMDRIEWVLEGGSIDSDGQGTLLTTKQCLLNPNRNPQFSQIELEEKLKEELGVDRILWLENGYLEGDDTDAHIDMLARFVSDDTIVYLKAYDSSDVHYEAFLEMERELKSFKTKEGKSYHLIPLPLPSPKFLGSERLPASYANFLIINRAVLLPIYDEPKDSEMVSLFKELFPTREIIPINALRLIQEGGSIHCSTMQICKKNLKK